jgi:hypothetical protein
MPSFLDEGKEGLTGGAGARDDQSECSGQVPNNLELEGDNCSEGQDARTLAPR